MKRLILIALVLSSCTTQQPAPPKALEPEYPTSGWKPTSLAVLDLAKTSSCARFQWADKKAALPLSFVQGVAAAYAQAHCKKSATSDPMSSKLDSRGRSVDFLKFYGRPAGNEKRQTYAMLFGLGMRESSGNFSEGEDKSVPRAEQSAVKAESGAWQFSYDSLNIHPELKALLEYYKAHKEECLADVFSKNVRVKTDGYFGEGVGLEFQKFTRSCPAFQAEYAAVMIRNMRTHFGPLLTKKAVYFEGCEDLLAGVEKLAVCL